MPKKFYSCSGCRKRINEETAENNQVANNNGSVYVFCDRCYDSLNEYESGEEESSEETESEEEEEYEDDSDEDEYSDDE